jgi:uncharacterized protein (DUF1778 family)
MAELRTEGLTIRFTKEEYETLTNAAKLYRRKMSDYCRAMALERAEQDLREAKQKEEAAKQPSAA